MTRPLVPREWQTLNEISRNAHLSKANRKLHYEGEPPAPKLDRSTEKTNAKRKARVTLAKVWE